MHASENIIDLLHSIAGIDGRRLIEKAMGWPIKRIGKVQAPTTCEDLVELKNESIIIMPHIHMVYIHLYFRKPTEDITDFDFFYKLRHYNISHGAGYPWTRNEDGHWERDLASHTWEHSNRYMRRGEIASVIDKGNKETVLFFHHVVTHLPHTFFEHVTIWNEELKQKHQLARYRGDVRDFSFTELPWMPFEPEVEDNNP